ncbi:MAG: hypothetical protein A3E38_00900 [Candidatus Moranbacteria bacterium RIFCSPHIGHO2_12_FULL_54_9]|nr:MAG: hypothetical protein A2878_03310 [Candidatus Moranbacteria bacterium RIFCSPHIGHO2_01_FULL_54_31]OGI26107.1 MAG: hypothetical protein A3E38_00900 [Candidatus Moranbacteria bacterium RIFCSPHIGHO2_12_FULL_54_9]
MKKFLILIAAAIIVIGGALFLTLKKDAPALPAKKTATLPDKTTAPQGMQEEKNSVANLLKDAMGLGKKMRCMYTVAGSGDAAVTSTVYVDGTTFKSEIEIGTLKKYVLVDDENQYSWDTATKEGFKVSKACLKSLQAAAPSGTPQVNDIDQFDITPGDNPASSAVADNAKCEAAPSADFSLPTDVTFTDQCEMMQQSAQMIERTKETLPAGTPAGY